MCSATARPSGWTDVKSNTKAAHDFIDVDLAAEMRAYDSLPPDARRALDESVFQYSALQFRGALAPDRIPAHVKKRDRELLAAGE